MWIDCHIHGMCIALECCLCDEMNSHDQLKYSNLCQNKYQTHQFKCLNHELIGAMMNKG